MRTISLRKFRDSIADLTEPVEVARRSDCEIQVIGTWTPRIIQPILIDLGPNATPADADRARERWGRERTLSPFTPVPKGK